MRSAFDKGFQNLAVQEGPEELPPPDDAPYHTGVIANGDGEFTDLSGVQGESDTDFASATQQSPGAYGPDGRLYFVQAGDDSDELMVADPNGGKPQKVGELNISGYSFNVVSGGTSPQDFPYFVPGDSRPQMYDSRYHEAACPDGWGFWTVGNDTLRYGKTGTKGSSIELTSGVGYDPIGCIDHRSFYDLSDTIYRVTITGGSIKKTKLLPKTDGEISQPVVSPDGQSIAFLLKKDDTLTLYTVPTTGGTPEKSHFELPAGPSKVIAWENVVGLN
jgi:hypothetical protein